MMKRSIGSKFLILMLVIVWSLGCSLIPALAPQPTPTLVTVPELTLPDSPTAIPSVPAEQTEVSSVTGIQTIEFIGKTFELQFMSTDQQVQRLEYYLPNESPSDWFELVEIQVYPVNPAGNEPIDFANRIANAFIQQYPEMKYSLLQNDSANEVILDFFYPTSTRVGYLEFNAFKFFKDPAGSQVIGFHYAKNVEDANSSRSYDDVVADLKQTIKEIESAMAQFDLFSN